MPWGVGLLGVVCWIVSALYAEDDLPALYLDNLALGDHYFQTEEYFYAFERYREATKYSNEQAEIHYRLGRIYGLLEPRQSLCEKEYSVAMTLLLCKFAGVDQVNLDNFRRILDIPIDPYEKKNPTWVNPVLFLKRDIDRDGQEECFVLMQRGKYSYALFVIDFFDYVPRVSHLVTFFEGASGRADVKFKDLNRDGREEVIVSSEMKDFTNLFIFTKTRGDCYQEVLNLSGLFLGTYVFVDAVGDKLKEVEIHEKVRKGIVFVPEEGPYITKKSIYKWQDGRYELFHTEVLYDEGYTLNQFFEALLLNNDFARAYRHIHPENFLRHLGPYNDVKALENYLRHPDFEQFLAENGHADRILKHMKLRKDPRYDAFAGWEEGGGGELRTPSIRDDELRYKLILPEESYSLILRNRGRWKIEHFTKDDFSTGGWAL